MYTLIGLFTIGLLLFVSKKISDKINKLNLQVCDFGNQIKELKEYSSELNTLKESLVSIETTTVPEILKKTQLIPTPRPNRIPYNIETFRK